MQDWKKCYIFAIEIKTYYKMKHAIIIKRWNKDEVKFFDTIEAARREWAILLSHKEANVCNKGKDIVIYHAGHDGLSAFYGTVSYQKTWND